MTVLKHTKTIPGPNNRENGQEQANEAWGGMTFRVPHIKNLFPFTQSKLTAHFFIPYPSTGTKLNTLRKKKGYTTMMRFLILRVETGR